MYSWQGERTWAVNVATGKKRSLPNREGHYARRLYLQDSPAIPRQKNIPKKSAEFQKHVQFLHLPAIGMEDLDLSTPIQPLSRLSLNSDKMADRCFFKWVLPST